MGIEEAVQAIRAIGRKHSRRGQLVSIDTTTPLQKRWDNGERDKEIRRLRREEKMSLVEIAKRYNITSQRVGQIVGKEDAGGHKQ